MEEELDVLRREFPEIKIVKQVFDPDDGDTFYRIRNLPWDPDLSLTVEHPASVKTLLELLRSDLVLFKDYMGIIYNDTVEVLLNPVNQRARVQTHPQAPVPSPRTLFTITLPYFNNELRIQLRAGATEAPVHRLYSLIIDAFPNRANVLTIQNFESWNAAGPEEDVRNVITSVLFDIEYTYNLSFEPTKLESWLGRLQRQRKAPQRPDHPIELVYKKYVGELIQYYHTAERVDFVPFKFICYYHIIEYFSDKSAYAVVASTIERLLKQPDFHINTNKYIDSAISIFRREADKYVSDKLKIERVLRQYVDREELKSALEDRKLLDTFAADVTLDCVKPLKLPAINFHTDSNFFENLTKRIYAVRCSVVHSNPDFDESKAVPFNPTPANIEKLRKEVVLMDEIARRIIVQSSD